MSKPKVGFTWLASCGGCDEAVFDLAEDLLRFADRLDIVLWPCAMDFKRADLEAMADGEMSFCFASGAIRSSEDRELAALCRRKAQWLVALGACAHLGGVPGLANLDSRESLLQTVYGDGLFANANPGQVRPQQATELPEGTVSLPTLDESVKALGQVVRVDYVLPGCPPPTRLIAGALAAIVEGTLPPPGAVLAPDVALCKECPRIESKPDGPLLREVRRLHEHPIDPEQCFLAQGLLCLGPATRDGCDHACIRGNMPCTGCLGPTGGTRDFGAAALSAVASLVDSHDEHQIAALVAEIPDPAGTFYRYSLPGSMLHKRAGGAAGGAAGGPASGGPRP